MNRRRLLLKTFILSSSLKNILKYEPDIKKRRSILGNYLAKGVLYGMEVFFAVGLSFSFFAADKKLSNFA